MKRNTKDKILKSALKLFAKQGLDKTSTAQITKDAGIASGTLFVHFKTKQELIDTLYIQIKRNLFSQINETIDLDAPVKENVKMISRLAIEYLLKNYNEFLFMGFVEIDPQMSDEAIEQGNLEYAKTTEAMMYWIKKGEFKKVTPELLGSIIWNTILAIVRDHKEKKLKTVDDVTLEIIWDAMKA